MSRRKATVSPLNLSGLAGKLLPCNLAYRPFF